MPLRWVVWALMLNLAWEVAQLPFYAFASGTRPLEIAWDVVHCTLGDVGIALNSARVVLVKGDLRGIVKARTSSAKAMRNIRENLFFAFVYNCIGVPIAAGVLYPWLGLLLSPIFASAAMALSSVSVIANALRLRSASV